MQRALSFLILFPALVLGLTPDEMVKKADEFRTVDGDYSFKVTVEDKTEKETKKTVYRVFVKDNNFTRIETLAPPRQVGRKLLMRDNDLWLYLPSIKRPTRIGFQQRLTGEVSNGDLARTNFSVDYKATSLGQEKVGEIDCEKLSLVAKGPNVTYGKIIYWIEKKTYRPVKAQFQAISGKILKSSAYGTPTPVMGTKLVTKILIVDALISTKQSLLLYEDYKKEKLSASLFNKETLSD